MKNERLVPADLEDLVKAIAWISSSEVACFAKAHPEAVRWTEIWAELRQSFGPTFASEAQHRTSIVLCWRNRKTRKTKERILFVGSGDCPICTANDLLGQLRNEIPEAFGRRRGPVPQVVVPSVGAAWPVGLLGPYVVGSA